MNHDTKDNGVHQENSSKAERCNQSVLTAGVRTTREIMNMNPLWVSPDTTLEKAAYLMGDRNVGAVVVCRDGEVTGIFTERDLLRRSASRRKWAATPVSEFMTRDPFTISAGQPWTTGFDLMGKRRVRHLPVIDEGRLVGMLSVRDLMEQRNRQLEELVGQRTEELQAKNRKLREQDRLMQYELDLAGKIQRQLLPAIPPDFSSLKLSVAYLPLECVSGDFYDFTILPDGRLGILIADACGHGVPAAFVSLMAKAAFEAHARGIPSPAEVLAAMSRHSAYLIDTDYFITMCCAVVDPRTLTLTYASAGHPPPLRCGFATGAVETLHTNGAMIGLMPEPAFEERSVQLEAGDTVLFYTDGILDCRDPAGEIFGRSRLTAFLRRHGESSIQGLMDSLQEELGSFHGSGPMDDDITCIGLKAAGEAPKVIPPR